MSAAEVVAAESAAVRSADDVLAAGPSGSLQLLEICSEPDGRAYAGGHLPGARWSYWRQLLWAESTRTIRSPESVRRALESAGFDLARPLFVYGEPVQYGAYAVWVLRAVAGLLEVAYLDGGKRSWRQAGGQLDTGGAPDPGWPEASPAASPDTAAALAPAAIPFLAGRADVLAAISAGVPIIDLRSTPEFRGEAGTPTVGKPTEVTRLGRVQGALSLPHTQLLDEYGRLRAAGELRAICESAGIGQPERCVVYCRSGHRSALGWLALHVRLGWPRVAVYDGAWLEWANLVGAPIETG